MDAAENAIMFLVFMPGRSGVNNIIGEAAYVADGERAVREEADFDLGQRPLRAWRHQRPDGDAGLQIIGQGHEEGAGEEGRHQAAASGHLVAGRTGKPGGDGPGRRGADSLRQSQARTTHRGPRYHPRQDHRHRSPRQGTLTVITGSHNLGYKASYCNDENLLIIEGNRDLAISYAVHVLDLYEHYLMRARLEENIRKDIIAGKLKSYEEATTHVVPHGLSGSTTAGRRTSWPAPRA